MNERARALRGGRLLRVALDLLATLLAWYGALALRLWVPLPFTLHLLPADRVRLEHPISFSLIAANLFLLLFLVGLYDRMEPLPRLRLLQRVLTAVTLHGLCLVGFFFFARLVFPRSVLGLYLILSTGLLLAARIALQSAAEPELRRVLLIGSGPTAAEIATRIGERHWHGLTVVGHVPAPDEVDQTPSPACGPRLGDLADIAAILDEIVVDEVVVASSPNNWQTQLVDRLAGHAERPNLMVLPGPFESLIGRMRYRWVHDLPLIEVVRRSEWRLSRPTKRVLDLSLGSTLLLLTSPVLAVACVAVAITSSGPVFYRQTRIGRDRQPFDLWKLRTMRRDAEAESGEILAVPNDSRLTAIGGLLRRTRIDEIPQLLNVLAGQMSLVGPRPERPGFVARFLAEVPGYAERFAILPGITGLAQVNGEYHSSAENKLRYDLAYLANQSLWLDLSILFRTVKTVLSTSGT